MDLNAINLIGKLPDSECFAIALPDDSRSYDIFIRHDGVVLLMGCARDSCVFFAALTKTQHIEENAEMLSHILTADTARRVPPPALLRYLDMPADELLSRWYHVPERLTGLPPQELAQVLYQNTETMRAMSRFRAGEDGLLLSFLQRQAQQLTALDPDALTDADIDAVQHFYGGESSGTEDAEDYLLFAGDPAVRNAYIACRQAAKVLSDAYYRRRLKELSAK